MNYKLHYEKLISKAQNRSILKSEYKEVHHIIPKCMGGDNSKENLIPLFPEEHFIAHLLLTKIYPNEKGLMDAVFLMSTIKRYSNKKYGWLRTKFIKSKSISMSGELNLKSLRIGIFNDDGELQYLCYGNFKKVCTENGLPHHSLNMSYKNNTKIFTTRGSIAAAKGNNKYQFKNWYAKLLDDNNEIINKEFNILKSGEQFGSNNSATKNIKIFNKDGKLEYETNDTFSIFCKNHNLPYEALRRSYMKKTKLYQNNRAISKAKQSGFEKFVGWYAIIN